MNECRLTRSRRTAGNDCDPQRSDESRPIVELAPTSSRDKRQGFGPTKTETGILTNANDRVEWADGQPTRRCGTTIGVRDGMRSEATVQERISARVVQSDVDDDDESEVEVASERLENRSEFSDRVSKSMTGVTRDERGSDRAEVDDIEEQTLRFSSVRTRERNFRRIQDGDESSDNETERESNDSDVPLATLLAKERENLSQVKASSASSHGRSSNVVASAQPSRTSGRSEVILTPPRTDNWWIS